jgi:selenoprotein W-related protein
LTAEILKEREIEIYVGSWKLIPSRGGVFEVTVNGALVFSKKALKRHAEPGEVRTAILRKLDELQPNRPVLIKNDSD